MFSILIFICVRNVQLFGCVMVRGRTTRGSKRARQLGGSFLSLLTKIGPKIIKKAIPVAAGLGVKAVSAAIDSKINGRKRRKRRNLIKGRRRKFRRTRFR